MNFLVVFCCFYMLHSSVSSSGLKTPGCPYHQPKTSKTCMMARQNHRASFVSQSIENGTFTARLIEGRTRSACDRTSKYRTISGSCNNLDNPFFGIQYSLQKRILPNAFADGSGSPRSKSVTGDALPSPRQVSLKVHQTTNLPDHKRTHLLMIWGQYLDHDITLTPVSSEACGGCESALNPKCLPIPIPDKDPVFKSGTCMSFTRSINGNKDGVTRETLNQVTSFIDSSNVYGSDTLVATQLRSFKDGKLRMQENNLLPINENQDFCQTDSSQGCFFAGDIRNSENMGLASIQTLFAQEHNKICDELKKLNPKWSDEKLYLEAKRIIDAEHQRITFKEWLPAVLGAKLISDLGLNEPESGSSYTKTYNSSCDPGISTEFSTAAFRFGHSLVLNQMQINKGNNEEEPFQLLYNFNNPSILYKNSENVQGLLLGASKQMSQANDRLIDDVLRDRLFETKNGEGAFDLAALNINRGRDHGIPPYTAYRKHFGLFAPSSFMDLFHHVIVDYQTMQALQNAYKHVDDIDLFTGIVSEMANSNSAEFILGEVGSRIIGDQFARLKHCDRFFYSNDPKISSGAFTPAQLTAIRKIKLSNVLCHHMSSSAEIQENAFFHIDNPNPLKKCQDLPPIDLSAWKENDAPTPAAVPTSIPTTTTTSTPSPTLTMTPTTTPATNAKNYIVKEHTRLHGHYDRNNQIDAEKCWEECKKKAECQASTWVDTDHRGNYVSNCYYYKTGYTETNEDGWTSYEYIPL